MKIDFFILMWHDLPFSCMIIKCDFAFKKEGKRRANFIDKDTLRRYRSKPMPTNCTNLTRWVGDRHPPNPASVPSQPPRVLLST